MTTSDKRKHFRKSLRAEAEIADVVGNTWVHVDFLDISSSGVAFISREEQTSGSSRMLRFVLPDHTRRITVVCKIVHNAEHAFLPGYRIGAEFVRIDEEDLLLINNFIQAPSEV